MRLAGADGLLSLDFGTFRRLKTAHCRRLRSLLIVLTFRFPPEINKSQATCLYRLDAAITLGLMGKVELRAARKKGRIVYRMSNPTPILNAGRCTSCFALLNLREKSRCGKHTPLAAARRIGWLKIERTTSLPFLLPGLRPGFCAISANT